LPFRYYNKKKRVKNKIKKEHKSLKAKRAENIRRKIKIKNKECIEDAQPSYTFEKW